MSKKLGSQLLILLIIAGASLSACKHQLLGEPAIIFSEAAELRSSTAKASRVVGTLKRGDQVSILEKSETTGETYIKVKGPGTTEGWLVARTLVTQNNVEKSKEVAQTISDIPAQAECRNRSSVKLRATPEKTNDENVIVQLPAGTSFEVIDREPHPKSAEKPTTANPKTASKPEADEKDAVAPYEVWYKVRVKENTLVPAGYIYAGSVDLDVPHDIAYFYQDGKKIVGWQKVGMVKDDHGQEGYHYLVLQKNLSASDEKSDFDYLQIVGFDPKNKSVSYYNVYREAIRGLFPIKVRTEDKQATVAFQALDAHNGESPVQYLVEQLDKGHVRAKRLGSAPAKK